MTAEPRNLKELKRYNINASSASFIDIPVLVEDEAGALVEWREVEALLQLHLHELSLRHGHPIQDLKNFDKEWKEQAKTCGYCYAIRLLRNLLGTKDGREK